MYRELSSEGFKRGVLNSFTITGHGFLIREFFRDSTKLPRGFLCPLLTSPLATLILAVAHVDMVGPF